MSRAVSGEVDFQNRVKNGSEANALSPSQVPPIPADRRAEVERRQLFTQNCASLPP